MRSGTKTEQVVIQSFTTSRDSRMEEIASWSAWRTVWCRAEAKRGREFFADGQRHAQTVYHLFFDYLDVDGLGLTMRVLWNGAYYDIKHIMPDHVTKAETMVEVALSRAGAVP